MTYSIDEILAIPENRETFNKLKEQLTKAICFVGAGASTPMYPLWGELLDEMTQIAVERGGDTTNLARVQDPSLSPQRRADIIREQLREPWYRECLEQRFRTRRDENGKRYTATHAALLSLPFRGYLTTNYDEGLAFAREEFRKQHAAVGTPTWQDEDIVAKWLNAKAFAENDDCPILWLHGVISQSTSCVLSTAEYEDAYKRTSIQGLFRTLWYREILVFVGVGFNDPFLSQILQEFLPDYINAGGAPNHFAFVSVPAEDLSSVALLEKVRRKREELEAHFNVRPIFYPVRDRDYGALTTLLSGLAPVTADRCLTVASPTENIEPLRASLWVHTPTNDARFKGREEELTRLNRFSNDAAIRCIGVTAVGGTGKTSLIGHWLGRPDFWPLSTRSYLFAWSFGEDSSSERFLAGFVEWAQKQGLGTPGEPSDRDVLADALELLERHAIALVIDGLEVLQVGPNGRDYGSLLDSRLQRLATELCRSKTAKSLLIMTSRFSFLDLERFAGTSCKQLFLDGLEVDAASNLLGDLGVTGSEEDRREVASNLDGHPLALRIFAEALPEEFRASPLAFWQKRLNAGSLQSTSPLYRKLNELLSFYQTQLSVVQRNLLSAISLFNSPIEEQRLAEAVKRLFPDLVDADVKAALASLKKRDLVMTQPIAGSGLRYSCHPVLADHFRSSLIGDDRAAREAVNLLSGNTESWEDWTTESLENLVQAIQILIDIGDFRAAQRRYSLSMPGLTEIRRIDGEAIALNCELAFIGDEALREACKEEELSNFDVAAHLHAAGIYTSDEKVALRFAEAALKLLDVDDVNNQIEAGYSLAESKNNLGYLDEALATYEELAAAARKTKAGKLSCVLMGRSRTLLALGRVAEALQDAIAADLNDKRNGLNSDHRPCGHNLDWVHLLMATRLHDLAETRLKQVSSYINAEGGIDQQRTCACCRTSVLLDIGRLKNAKKVARIFADRSSLTSYSISELLCLSKLATAQGEIGTAASYADQAMSYAQSKYQRLSIIDALIARANARLASGNTIEGNSALDDLEHAVSIAEEVGSMAGKLSAMRSLTYYYERFFPPLDGKSDGVSGKRQRVAEDLQYLERLFTLSADAVTQATSRATAWLEAK